MFYLITSDVPITSTVDDCLSNSFLVVPVTLSSPSDV